MVAGGSVCSSPDLDGAKLGTSPQINRFLAREPPDGCEKVILIIVKKTEKLSKAPWKKFLKKVSTLSLDITTYIIFLTSVEKFSIEIFAFNPHLRRTKSIRMSCIGMYLKG